jgi:hypothetical protein
MRAQDHFSMLKRTADTNSLAFKRAATFYKFYERATFVLYSNWKERRSTLDILETFYYREANKV